MLNACRMLAVAVLAGILPVPATASPSSYLVPVGEARVYRLERPVKRVAVGDPEVADYLMINPSELYLLGKKPGATNLVVWDRNGNFISMPLQVSRNIRPIKELLKAALPDETDIRVYASGPALVLAGTVADTMAAETAVRIVTACSGGAVPVGAPESTLAKSAPAAGYAVPVSVTGMAAGSPAGLQPAGAGASEGMAGVVNLLKVRELQQVRLEVHIAEVSRSRIESLGLGWTQGVGSPQGSLMTGFVNSATLDLLLKTDRKPDTTVGNRLEVEAERKAGRIKILAEPTIVAMSGQEGYFLVGGKLYTPTVTGNGAVDYVERTYGVGLRFTPTVLDAGRISLKVAPEVSEPLIDAVYAGSSGNLPVFKTSFASTTVMMNEGENLVIGGLLRDNLSEVVRSVPLLGDIPLLGALFRHTEQSSETTELMVVVRPTLVKATLAVPEMPTDRFVPPTANELFIGGKLEGSRRVR